MQLFTSCVSTTLVLVLLGLVVFFGLTAHKLSRTVREELIVTVLLSDEATDKDADRFQVMLGTERFVNRLKYISKEQALQEQKTVTGSDPAEFLGFNPFTASFEVQLNADYANTDSLCWITQKLKANEWVSDVLYQKDLIDNLNRNLHRAGWGLLALAALLGVVSISLINNTVRLSIYSRRFLIHTMKLVGASWGFIRRPFMLRGLGVGVVSALVADSLLLGGIRSLMRFDEFCARLITWEMLAVVTGSVLLFGLCITLACSYFSVNTFLRMKEHEMYEH